MVEAARRAEAALEESGSVYTIGVNRKGQLGLGDCDEKEREFHVISELRGKAIVQVVAAGDIAIARSDDGNVFAWGGGGEGPVGVKPYEKHLGKRAVNEEEMLATFATPQLIESLQGEGIVHVTVGPNHAGAVSDGGDCYMWGDGTRGQLGTGNYVVETTPVLVEALQEGKIISQLVVGQTHTLAVTTKHDVYSWGFANSGKLGLGVKFRKGVKKTL